MKAMFPLMISVGDMFAKCLRNAIESGSEVELYEWAGRFTTDMIGTCAFGVECNSLKDPKAKFREMGRKVFENPKLTVLEQVLIISFPKLAQFFRIRTHYKDISDFFMNMVEETVEYREKNNVQRNDIMNLLIGLKNSEKDDEKLTITEVAAQAFIFWIAGFETSSTTSTFCLYELALNKNKHIRDKATREITDILKKYDGNLTYEAINEMTYIEHIIYGEYGQGYLFHTFHSHQFSSIDSYNRNTANTSTSSTYTQNSYKRLQSAELTLHDTQRNACSLSSLCYSP